MKEDLVFSFIPRPGSRFELDGAYHTVMSTQPPSKEPDKSLFVKFLNREGKYFTVETANGSKQKIIIETE